MKECGFFNFLFLVVYAQVSHSEAKFILFSKSLYYLELFVYKEIKTHTHT